MGCGDLSRASLLSTGGSGSVGKNELRNFAITSKMLLLSVAFFIVMLSVAFFYCYAECHGAVNEPHVK
jgi:hypothetical protein